MIFEIFTFHPCVYHVLLEVITKYRDKISSLEKDIKEKEHQEKEEREMRATENQMNKAKRILEESGGSEQAKRAWFQTHKERLQERGTAFITNSPAVTSLTSFRGVRTGKESLIPDS